MARSEELYLRDISESVALLREYLRGRTREDLLTDRGFQDSVVHRLEIIGEAAAHLSDDLRSRYGSVEWSDVVGFRNVAVHGYFSLDLDIVWAAATLDAPQLGQLVDEILDREYPSAAPIDL
jgi:uncharacterized protein with HEPN domain